MRNFLVGADAYPLRRAAAHTRLFKHLKNSKMPHQQPHHTHDDHGGALPPPRGYLADKLALAAGAVSALLHGLGLRLKTTDDSRDADTAPSAPASPAADSGPHSHPLLQDLTAGLERVLHESGAAADALPTHQVLMEARMEERLARHAVHPGAAVAPR
jgi:hypothetical protein